MRTVCVTLTDCKLIKCREQAANVCTYVVGFGGATACCWIFNTTIRLSEASKTDYRCHMESAFALEKYCVQRIGAETKHGVLLWIRIRG